MASPDALAAAAPLTVVGVRRACYARVRQAGAQGWLLALSCTIGAKLIVWAASSAPGEPPADFAFVAPIVGFFLPFLAIYVAARRMAGLPHPFRGGRPVLRFTLWQLAWGLGYVVPRLIAVNLLALDYRRIETHWAGLFGYFVVWNLVLIRLIGFGPGFALGEPSRHAAVMWREMTGQTVRLALGFLVLVAPLGAVAIALSVIVERLFLDDDAQLGLLIGAGAAEAAVLIAGTALGVVAWQIAWPALKRTALRS